VIVHPTHELADRSSVELKELANEEFIMMPPNTLLGQSVSKMLDNEGIEVNSRLQVSQTSSCYNLVANGYGVSISDAMIPSFALDSVKIVSLRPEYLFEIGMLYVEDGQEIEEISALLDVIRDEAMSYMQTIPLPKL
jgi:DNA-binding transcriptional LysR family regulator